jgi:hypothetical protein
VALLKEARDESAVYVSGGAGDEDGLGHWPHRQQGLGVGVGKGRYIIAKAGQLSVTAGAPARG